MVMKTVLVGIVNSIVLELIVCYYPVSGTAR